MHLNVSTKNNKNHMLKNNTGFGDNRKDNNEYIERSKSNTTPHQFNKFKNNANPGDIIILYENKKGHIFWKFTGEIYSPLYVDFGSESVTQ